MKISAPEFLTEEEEFALRRLELLREIRGKAAPKWTLYVPLVIQLPMAGWLFYDGCVRFQAGGPQLSAFISIGGAVMLATLAIAFFFVVPMRQRLDAIAKLLEDEVKRTR